MNKLDWIIIIFMLMVWSFTFTNVIPMTKSIQYIVLILDGLTTCYFIIGMITGYHGYRNKNRAFDDYIKGELLAMKNEDRGGK